LKTDTSEAGLETLIVTAMAGRAEAPPNDIEDGTARYGAMGWKVEPQPGSEVGRRNEIPHRWVSSPALRVYHSRPVPG
jgi:hypothetical protein